MKPQKSKLLFECSIPHFIKEFRSTKHRNIEDAIVYSMMYLLRYGADQRYTNCDLHELIYNIKNELARYVAKDQIDAKTTDATDLCQGDENNKTLQHLFRDPMGFMKIMLEHDQTNLYNNLEIDDNEVEEYALKITNSKANLIGMLGNNTIKRMYDNFERDKDNNYDLKNTFESKFPKGRNSINSSLNKQKPGIFERLFKTTSEEYGNFKAAYQNFNNPSHQLAGNTEVLRGAAMGYLRHKFPGLKEGKLPTEREISRLGGTGKERASFCLKIVQSIDDENEIQAQANLMLSSVKNMDLPSLNQVIEQKNQELQNKLKNELEVNINDIKEIPNKENNDVDINAEYENQIQDENNISQ